MITTSFESLEDVIRVAGVQNSVIPSNSRMVNRALWCGRFIILFFLVLTFLKPWLIPFDPEKQDLTASLQPPSATHWMGTDFLGRDLFSRILQGTQQSLFFGIAIAISSLIIGALIGLAAGFYGGIVDIILMRITDFTLAFPAILFVMAFLAFTGEGTTNIILALVLVGWPNIARLVRCEVMRVKAYDFVEASRVMGATSGWIMYRHILPHLKPVLSTQGSLAVGYFIMAEAALSFLGFGPEPPDISWGYLLNDAMPFIAIAPWLIFFPGLFLSLLVMGFVLVGEGSEQGGWRG